MTLFHRATTDAYPPPCDVAAIPVFDADNQPAGFIGASWGEWPDPPACLNWAICRQDEIDAVLATWGLHRQVEPPLGPT